MTGIAAGKTALVIAKEELITIAAEHAIEMAVEKAFQQGTSRFHRVTGFDSTLPAGVLEGTGTTAEQSTTKGGSSMDQ